MTGPFAAGSGNSGLIGQAQVAAKPDDCGFSHARPMRYSSAGSNLSFGTRVRTAETVTHQRIAETHIGYLDAVAFLRDASDVLEQSACATRHR